MTTRVIIQSPSPNHQNVKVETTSGDGREPQLQKVLTDGEEIQLYVYPGQQILISEVPKA